MRKIFHILGVLVKAVLIINLANIRVASGQTSEKQEFPIPENINMIFQTSCLPCHGNNGGRLPKSKLNFSRWEAYGAAKEKEKSSSICTEVRKGKMPPRSARESNPELIPTKEQIDLICKWAESLIPEKENK
jgi:mono/diheme cytochrome c family protein